MDGINLKSSEDKDLEAVCRFDESFPYHEIDAFSSLNPFNSELIAFALVFILISLFFKLAIVPFHSCFLKEIYMGLA